MEYANHSQISVCIETFQLLHSKYAYFKKRQNYLCTLENL